MILLDTNVLSELMKSAPDQHVLAWLNQQPAASLFISAITRAEIELGIALLPNGTRKQAIETAALQMFTQLSDRCLVFGESAAIQYGQLVAERTKQGQPISVEDAQIAAIALAHGMILATRNTKDFVNISPLTLFNPFEP